jgi:hypothetical protein
MMAMVLARTLALSQFRRWAGIRFILYAFFESEPELMRLLPTRIAGCCIAVLRYLHTLEAV